MFHQRLMVKSSGGYEVPLDAYIPTVWDVVTPGLRRRAVVICPGGGYSHLSDREGEPIALRFMALGFNAFVVKYRLAPNRYPQPQQDAAAAVAYVRAHAEELHTDPDKIAIMGFSAGGHLAASLGVWWQRAELWAGMGLTPGQVKPNALVLCYPVITAGEYAHRGSFRMLTGEEDISAHDAMSLEKYVTSDCPPAFLWHTFEDSVVPVQNTLLMTSALAREKVLSEVHIYPHGGHGSALCNEQTAGVRNPHFDLPDNAGWPELAAKFLKDVLK